MTMSETYALLQQCSIETNSSSPSKRSNLPNNAINWIFSTIFILNR